MTLQNGNAAIIRANNSRQHIANGGDPGDACSNGGIIWLENSTLNLDSVRISGGLGNDGGAINIERNGILNVNDSTFDGNFARDDGGVFDIDDQGAVFMVNSTITRNQSGVNTNPQANNGGLGGTGGIARVEGILSLTYVTAAYNVAGGDGAFDIRSTSTFTLRNSLLVDNTFLLQPNTVTHCDASTYVNDSGDNWADTNDCGTNINVDTAANIELSETLATNGGTTPTLALANTSSVNGIIETTDSLCPGGVGADDQRDVARAVNAGCEPGAYELQLPVPTDYGDAPSTYGNAVHNIPASPGLYLGSVAPDGEVSTRAENTSGAADGDDDDNVDDDDAFDSLADVPIVGNYSLNVPLTSNLGTATLHAWIDFNQNDVFDAGEYQSAAVAQNDTSANLNWAIPIGTIVGETYARFRLTSDTSIDSSTPDGIATDGEVEDYPVTLSVPIYDYGDAPDTGAGTGTGNYQTTANDNGAAQVVINAAGQILSIGNTVDTDDGSFQNADATADDTLDSADDEDGITTFPTITDEAGQTYTVSVPVRNNVGSTNAYLVGYIDFNRDGQFDGANERSNTAVITPNLNGDAQTVDLTFTTPAGMTPGNTFVRLRLGQVQATAVQATGAAISTDNGEIEDHQIAIAPANGNISGTIFDDANRNDVRDSSEDPLADIFVALFRDLNNDGIINDDADGDGRITFADAVASQDSDANGNYGFNVADGNYIVFVDLNDTDLAGRTYGGVTGTPNDPLNARRNADVSGSNIAVGLDYPFERQLPPNICDANDPTEQLNFLDNPTLIEGNPLQIGAVYRFDTVFDDVDALVEVVQFNGGATLGAVDNNAAGEPSAFQPTLNATSGSATSSVDFEVRLIDANTGLPAIMNFKAAGVDIDGDSNQLREFIELTDIASFTLDPNTTIDVTSNPPVTRFESNTTDTQPGISTQALQTLVIAEYNATSQFRYSIGAINQGSTTALGRLNSLYIGCAERVESELDYGDAPDTYGTDNTPDNSSNTSDPLGAIHLINPDLFLGATVPDAEANGFVDGTDDNGNATDDDDPSGTGTGNGDDEDNFALPSLRTGDTSYTIPASTLVATNNTGQAATLHAWIDFDNSGTFEDSEHASVTINEATNNGNPTGDLTWNNINVGAVGNTYARFRLTTDDSIDNTTPGGAAIDGEVEDYIMAIAPALLCPAARADLWFANDESGSVSNTEFENALDFLYQISDGFVYDNNTGIKAGITGWTDLVNSAEIIIPITESFGDPGDFGLFTNSNIALDGDGQGVRELYSSKQNISPGTRLDRATNYLADLIIAGNGKRPNTPQVVVMLTDADRMFIEDTSEGGFFAWIAEANQLRSTGAEIVLILIDEAAAAYNSPGFARFIIDDVVGANGRVITVPNYADAADSTLGYVNAVSQAICDLSTPVASDPNLLLVKRITAINPGQPGEIQFNDFVDNPNSINDNHPLWPDSDEDPSTNTNLYLRGVLDGGTIKPGDEVEYTVYFLSNGDDDARDVRICDVVPDHLTYVKDAYGLEIGIGLGFNPTVVPTAPNRNLTNLLNDDEGDFYGAGTAPPANLCKKVDENNNLVTVDGSNNDNGAIIVQPAPLLPPATSPGQPAGSYGFIRFRGKVK
ncbi:MAG: GEVED domain-containing protein [Cyanobacteria bacterium J06629_2]